jgi:hypothetical protein
MPETIKTWRTREHLSWSCYKYHSMREKKNVRWWSEWNTSEQNWHKPIHCRLLWPSIEICGLNAFLLISILTHKVVSFHDVYNNAICVRFPPKLYPSKSMCSGLWQRIVLFSGWRWRQHGPLELWYPKTLYCIINLKTSTWKLAAVKTSELALHIHPIAALLIYINWWG